MSGRVPPLAGLLDASEVTCESDAVGAVACIEPAEILVEVRKATQSKRTHKYPTHTYSAIVYAYKFTQMVAQLLHF